jgi:D-3-phosphoglycerate dehydrogenase
LEVSSEISDLKTLLVGVGRIGSKVAGFLKANGAEVRGVDPYLSPSRWAELGIESTSYIQGLHWCNLVTFHCPLTNLTRHYFSQPLLKTLKAPIWLLNVSRGSVVEEKALEIGLKSGMIKAAGIDVFEEEPWETQEFASLPNLYLTPHTGAFTEKAKERLVIETLDVWSSFVQDNKLVSEVVRWDLIPAKG